MRLLVLARVLALVVVLVVVRAPVLAYLLVSGLARFLATIPLGWALALGRVLGAVAFHVVRIRRGVVLENLRHAFGARFTEAELRAIAADTYRQFAMTFVEFLRSSVPGSRGLGANVSFDPLEPFDRLRAEKTPVIFIQGHFGNFDLVAYAFAARGFPHHTVMKGLKNDRLERMIVATRVRNGVTVHLKGSDSYREVLDALKAGDWVGLLPDQRARRRGATVDFLGRPATIFQGPALFHLETGAPICMAIGERSATDPTRHHVAFRFVSTPAPTGDRDEDARAIMQAIIDALADAVRANPSHYFWFHRLWGKPDAAPDARVTATIAATA